MWSCLQAMSDSVLISCNFSVVAVSVLTLVLISCACTAANTTQQGWPELRLSGLRGGAGTISSFAHFSVELGHKMHYV